MKTVLYFVMSASLLGLAGCMNMDTTQQTATTQAGEPRPIQETVPTYSSTIPAQTYYFNPARAGSSGN